MKTPTALQGKISVVTGGSSGIGKAIVENLFINGAIVVNADKTAGDAVPDKDIRSRNNNYFFHKTDTTIGEEVQQLLDSVTAIGSPQILVCNAGVGIHETLAEGDPEKWFQVIDTNLIGTLRLLRSFLPQL